MWWCCARPAADGSPRSHRTTEEYGAPKLLTPASAKDQQIVRAEASYSTPARAAAAARQLLDKPLNKLTAIELSTATAKVKIRIKELQAEQDTWPAKAEELDAKIKTATEDLARLTAAVEAAGALPVTHMSCA